MEGQAGKQVSLSVVSWRLFLVLRSAARAGVKLSSSSSSPFWTHGRNLRARSARLSVSVWKKVRQQKAGEEDAGGEIGVMSWCNRRIT